MQRQHIMMKEELDEKEERIAKDAYATQKKLEKENLELMQYIAIVKKELSL